MREIRVSIAIIVSILMSVGIVMIYSSSGIYAYQNHGYVFYYLKRHLTFLFLGLLLTGIVMVMDYRILQRYAKPLMLLAIFMLILVLIPGIGTSTYGARRWFKVAGFSFQPSEFTKLVLLIYAADYLTRKKDAIRNFKEGLLPLLIVLGIVSLLILKQPDLGSSFSLAVIVMMMIFLAGVRLHYVFYLLIVAVPVLFYLVVRVPYRFARILSFLNPWADSQGSGFQLIQSQIALGSGGIWGVGLGHSIQKLFYLPAAHTDFILSIIGEELGILGTLSVILLFILLIWQGARIAKRVTDPFGYYLAVGIVAMLGFQAVVNVGVSIGALPTKGLPLPFISYGGSALIFNLIAVGLLLNISRIHDLRQG